MPPLKDEARREAVAVSRRRSLLTVGEAAATTAVDRLARDIGFDVVSHDDTDVLDAIRRILPDAVFVDVVRGGPDVFPLLRAIRDVEPSCAVILAGSPSADSTIEAVKLGALDFLASPLDVDRVELAPRAIRVGLEVAQR